jgi:hypothetical protein
MPSKRSGRLETPRPLTSLDRFSALIPILPMTFTSTRPYDNDVDCSETSTGKKPGSPPKKRRVKSGPRGNTKSGQKP